MWNEFLQALEQMFDGITGALTTAGKRASLWVVVAIATAAWVLGILFLSVLVPLVWDVVEVAAGILVFLFIFPIIPGVIDSLVQQPNRWRPSPEEIGKSDSDITTRDYPPSKFGYFVFLQPGRDIRIEQGGRAVRGIMKTGHKMYLGERNDNTFSLEQAEYWENVQTETQLGYKDSHPIPAPWNKCQWFWYFYSPLSILWWLWKRYVYWVTGAVFTGFYPFQMPRVVPMERFVLRMVEGKAKVDRIEDYSNHYRVEQFVFPMLISEMDTNNMVPLKVIFNVVARVTNAYLTAYRADDRWTSRLIASITDPVTTFAKTKKLNELWVADSIKAARELAEAILEVCRRDPLQDPRSPRGYGISVDSVEIIDISPINPEDTEKFGAAARAEVEMRAKMLLAKGNAAPIEENIKALAANEALLRDNPNAMRIAELNTQVEVAKAAGANGNLVIVNGNSNTDQTQAALLQTLRRLEQGRRSEQEDRS